MWVALVSYSGSRVLFSFKVPEMSHGTRKAKVVRLELSSFSSRIWSLYRVKLWQLKNLDQSFGRIDFATTLMLKLGIPLVNICTGYEPLVPINASMNPKDAGRPRNMTVATKNSSWIWTKLATSCLTYQITTVRGRFWWRLPLPTHIETWTS